MVVFSKLFAKALASLTRTGNLVLEDGSRYYIFGDIHGRLDLLQDLLAAVRQDLKDNPVEKATQIFLGDYIDRGPASAQVIDALAKKPDDSVQRLCLMGNHEYLFIRFLADPSILPQWLQIGGDKTLLSYGIEVSSLKDDPKRVRQRLLSVIPGYHLDFLRSLKLFHRVNDYAFVHAGVRPGIPLERQEDQDLLWIREEFLDYTRDFGVLVFHGHTPREDVVVLPNRVGLDTGAFISGKLTCAILEGTGLRFLQTRPEGVVALAPASVA